MALTMGLGLWPVRGGGTAPPPEGFIAVDAPPRDRMVYDAARAVSHALGLDPANDRALVGASGRAAPGAQVEIRLEDEDGTVVPGAGATAVADPSGRWSATCRLMARPGWQRLRARMAGGAWTAPAPDHRIAAGDVIALWGQSVVHHMWTDYNDTWNDGMGIPVPAIPDPDAVQIAIGHEGARTPRLIRCADGAWNMTAGMAAFAAQWIALVPGRKLQLISQTQSGTDWKAVLQDDNPNRSWALDKAIHDLGTGDGASGVGLVADRWYFDPSFGDVGPVAAQLPFAALVDPDGTPVATPYHTVGGDTRMDVDHDLTELYGGDFSRYRHVADEPIGFVNGGRDMDESRLAARRQAAALPGAQGRYLAPGIAPMDVTIGELIRGGANRWQGAVTTYDDVEDGNHPAADEADGVQRLARYHALGYAHLLGHYVVGRPVIDECAWTATEITLGWSGGPLTTRRLAEGLPALDRNVDPRFREVIGPEIRHTQDWDARIVNGKIVLTPENGLDLSDPNLDLWFGRNAGFGYMPDGPRAKAHRVQRNYPVAGAHPGIGPIAVLPFPDPKLIANPFVDRPRLERGAGGATWGRGAQIGTGTHAAFTAAFAFRLDSTEGPYRDRHGWQPFRIRRSTGAHHFEFHVDLHPNSRHFEMHFPHAGRIERRHNGGLSNYQFDGWNRIVLRVEGGNRMQVQVNNKMLYDVGIAAVPLSIGTQSEVVFLDGFGQDVACAFEPLRLWWGTPVWDGLPAGAPDIDYGDSLAAANAHPLKTGPDAAPW